MTARNRSPQPPRASNSASDAFLTEGGFGAFTDTFEDLHGMAQLPGIATQRMMAAGFGFGGEGDWKTAALVRIMKIMAQGHRRQRHQSFVEDYTYDLAGRHDQSWAPTCWRSAPAIADGETRRARSTPSASAAKPTPSASSSRRPPAPAVVASIVDMGNRFRMIVNDIDVVSLDQPMPNLPVASTLWHPRPDLKTAAAAWIYSGGAHHTSFSQSLTMQHMEDFAEIAGIELVRIDAETKLHQLRRELTWTDAAYRIGR